MANLPFLLVFTLFSAILLTACSEDGTSASDGTFDASVVCPENLRGTFTDARDGQVYKYTTIGNQVWMAENLKFDAPYSLCYDKIEGFCDTFGRFYSLHVNGEYFDLFDQELLDSICPVGWHVPTVDEWNVLADNMGGTEKAGVRLKSSENFGEYYKRGEDDCLFSALPAGYWLLNGTLDSDYFVTIAYWTSTKKSNDVTYAYHITTKGTFTDINHPKMTIRCIKD